MNQLRVYIRYFSALREITQVKEDVMDVTEGCTVLDLLHLISDKYGDNFTNYLFDIKTNEPRPYLQFFIDDTPISELKSFATTVAGGSTLAIIPPIGGG